MSNVSIDQLPAANTIDAVQDLLPIYQKSSTSTLSINRNTLLGLSSAPVGLTDTQTLTNKTLTSPTISGPTLSGTITGTYTIGGTPTFPSSVVTLSGTQTLTNKTLTSPTISSPTITNATISADTITGFTTSTSGTIYGIAVTSGAISSNLSLTGSLSVTGATTLSSTLAVSLGTTLSSTLSVTGAISGAGYTMKTMANPYKFQVHHSTSQTITTGADRLVHFDTKDYDTGSNFDNVTNFTFTAPVNGFYEFSAFLGFSSATSMSRLICTLYKNGATYIRIGDYGNTGSAAGGTNGEKVTLQLNANDTIAVFATAVGANASLTGGTGPIIDWFCGELVSAT